MQETHVNEAMAGLNKQEMTHPHGLSDLSETGKPKAVPGLLTVQSLVLRPSLTWIHWYLWCYRQSTPQPSSLSTPQTS